VVYTNLWTQWLNHPSVPSVTGTSIAELSDRSSEIDCRVHTGQGKLEKVREFEWSGKVRENAKVTGKSEILGENFTFLYSCCNANNSRAGVKCTILLAVVVCIRWISQ